MATDASRSGLGATIFQVKEEVKLPIAFASRFLNGLEEKYSTNELEILGVVWGCEHFQHYLVGKQFTIKTDHQAIVHAIGKKHLNKVYCKRLTRWLTRLFPFDFKIEYSPGKLMGFTDFLSRNPCSQAKEPDFLDDKFVISVVNKLTDTFKGFRMEGVAKSEAGMFRSNYESTTRREHAITRSESKSDVDSTEWTNQKLATRKPRSFPPISHLLATPSKTVACFNKFNPLQEFSMPHSTCK